MAPIPTSRVTTTPVVPQEQTGPIIHVGVLRADPTPNYLVAHPTGLPTQQNLQAAVPSDRVLGCLGSASGYISPVDTQVGLQDKGPAPISAPEGPSSSRLTSDLYGAQLSSSKYKLMYSRKAKAQHRTTSSFAPDALPTSISLAAADFHPMVTAPIPSAMVAPLRTAVRRHR
jgi:hypothetical protein